MLTKMAFASLVFVFSVFSYASEVLCTINSDIDSNKAVLTYDMNEETEEITHIYQETYENDRMTARDELNVDALTHGGVILLQKDKYIIVRIWSDNFDRNLGGVMYVDTLYSGLSGERRQYEIDLTKSKTGLSISNNKVDFTKMKFIAKRSKIFGVIGIEKILFSK